MKRGSIGSYLIYFLAAILVIGPHYLWGFSFHGFSEWTLSPVYGGFSLAEETAVSTLDYVHDRSHLLKRLERLQSRQQQLLRENRKLALIARQNRSLRQQLGFPADTTPRGLVPAEIIHTDFGQWERTFRLNRGSRSGLEPGDPVVRVSEGETVLYGILEHVVPGHSVGILISDPRFRVGVIVEGIPSRQFVARGAGARGLVVENFPRVLSVQSGRVVRTAPASSLMPEGIRLGTIHSFSRSNQRRSIGRELIIEPVPSAWLPDPVWVLSDDR